ncbi:hypothetical protein [Caloramator sp. ALD01]|uniref:hypothetical protein n=1 Tax=Caloramator sp. ALD01 TaxID=1031288 RepID=UPI0004104076|nr:hypothetical protein [Caloramator sp. ALD01]
MKLILLNNVLNRVSFVFLVLFSIFTIKDVNILFLYTLLTVSIFTIMDLDSFYIYLFLIIPAIFYRSSETFLFILSYTIMLYWLFRNRKSLFDYYYFKDYFKTANKLIGAAIFIHIIIYMTFKDITFYGSIFLIFYTVTSVLLLRILRVFKIDGDVKINKFNAILMSSLLSFSIILSIPQIRGFIFKMLFYLYYYVTLTIAYVLAFFIFSFIKIFTLIFGEVNIRFNLDNMPNIKNSSNEFIKLAPNKNTLIDAILNSPIIGLIIKAILFLIFIWIVVSILKRISISSNSDDEFVELKESIKITEVKKKQKKYNLDDKVEYIRFKYFKFLKSLKKNKIDILSSDTSLDINNKAKGLWDNLDEIRNIYIKARYNNTGMDKELVDKIFKK